MNMQTEPIRLPAWLSSLLAVAVLPFVIALLTGIDWQDALAVALTAVIPLVGVAETARAFTDSPATRAGGDRGNADLVTIIVSGLIAAAVAVLVVAVWGDQLIR